MHRIGLAFSCRHATSQIQPYTDQNNGSALVSTEALVVGLVGSENQGGKPTTAIDQLKVP